MASEELILEITAKLDQAMSDVQALQDQINELAGTATEVTVALTAEDNATEVLDAAQEAVAELDGAEAEIGLDADDNATDALEDVRGAVDDLDGETAEVEVQVEGGEEAEANLGGIGESLAALGPAALGGVAAAGLGQVALKSAEATLSIKGLADATGASLEAASGLAEQFDFVGVSTEKLQTMIGRVSDTIGATPELAARLGVDAALPPLELFIAAVDALNSSQLSANDKLRLGIDLFGRRGLNAVQAIGTQIGDLSTAVDNIPDFQVVTEEDISSAIEMKETMDQLGDAVAEAAQQVVTVLGPALEGVKIALAELPTIDIPGVDLGGVFEGAFDTGAIESMVRMFTDQEEVVRQLTDAIEENRISRIEWNAITADSVVTTEEVTAAAQDEATIAGQLGDVWGDAASGLEEVTAAAAPVPRALDAINDALLAQDHATAAADQNWKILLKDLEDGEINTVGASIAFQNLQTQLQLSDEAMDALVGKKLDDHMADIAKAEEEAAAEALRLNQAIADLGDTIADIDTDDLANIGSALAEALDVGGMAVNLQVEEAEVRAQVDQLATDIQTFIDENGPVDWSVVLDPTKSAEGFDAGLAGMIGGLQDTLQTGITNAFQSGGAPAAMAFVNEFMPTLRGLGMTTDQIREFMGIPEDGNIPVFLQVLIDQEAKADALAILDSLIGVDPNNPRLAYIRLAVQTGDIDPQVAEIAARLLAAEALQVPAKLEEFTQEDIDAAVALLAGHAPIPVPVEIDDGGTVDEFAGAADEATADRTTQVIVPKSDSLGAMQILIDHVARAREVAFNAKADNAGAIDRILDAVAGRRNAPIYVQLPNIWDAEQDLATLARRRDANIYVHTVATGGGGGGGGGATPGTLAAPTALGDDEEDVGVAALDTVGAGVPSAVTMAAVAPTPTVIVEPHVSIQAGVIGNPFEVQRAVRKALRQSYRINGRRRVA